MLLAVSTTQSTLYDQIQYSGSPSSFAWVLPIHGVVQVGLSADVLFDSIAALTDTLINPPAPNCPSPTNCFFFGASDAGGVGGRGRLSQGPGVQVLVAQNVGPYATVQLHSTDGSALSNWLAANGYAIPTAVQPILSAYVAEGFDFLAMKLLPDQGVQAMRPVRVTTSGASLSLPLRMASIGTGAVTGITIWIVADGRYEPQNFSFFHIDDSQLVWDWAASRSNYTRRCACRTRPPSRTPGWEIESSLDLNENLISQVIQSGGQYYGNGFGGAVISDPALDYLPIGDADAGGDGGVDGVISESAEQVREDDIKALFVGMTGPSVRVTRIRSDIAQSAMTSDIVFKASSDQSELSNVRNVTQSVNLTCPIYDGCNVVGSGTLAQAQASIDDSGAAGDASDAGGSSGGSGGSDATAGNDATAGDATAGNDATASSHATGGDDATSGDDANANADRQPRAAPIEPQRTVRPAGAPRRPPARETPGQAYAVIFGLLSLVAGRAVRAAEAGAGRSRTSDLRNGAGQQASLRPPRRAPRALTSGAGASRRRSSRTSAHPCRRTRTTATSTRPTLVAPHVDAPGAVLAGHAHRRPVVE